MTLPGARLSLSVALPLIKKYEVSCVFVESAEALKTDQPWALN
ncbi:hypothetical protein [Candidatus Odyssella thessalonicensis]|nr:hypothetical protein [Candidatus Odyssella thessalonicensis]